VHFGLKSLTDIEADQHQFGHLANAGMIEADRNVYGRVYRSTAGMGIPFMDAENPVTSLEIDRLTDVLLYPNPFRNTINLKSDSPIDRIQVYNLAGSLIQTIVSAQISNQALEFGSDLKSGMYLVKVLGNSSMRKFKIIKN